MSESSEAAPVHAVERRGEMWAATCDHGHEVWYLERGTEHHAWSSLRAHARNDVPMCMCGHRWWRHQDSNLSPECLDCDCVQFEELTPAGWLARWTVKGEA